MGVQPSSPLTLTSTLRPCGPKGLGALSSRPEAPLPWLLKALEMSLSACGSSSDIYNIKLKSGSVQRDFRVEDLGGGRTSGPFGGTIPSGRALRGAQGLRDGRAPALTPASRQLRLVRRPRPRRLLRRDRPPRAQRRPPTAAERRQRPPVRPASIPPGPGVVKEVASEEDAPFAAPKYSAGAGGEARSGDGPSRSPIPLGPGLQRGDRTGGGWRARGSV